jgi:hypothetical protein
MIKRVAIILRSILRFVRWIYFLRFSLALWLFPLVLVGFNMLDQTLTSGVLVPEFLQGYLCVAFFLVSSGFAALISSRVTLINGPERWNTCPELPDKRQPTPLDWLLVNEKGKWEWLAIVVSLLPALLTGLYLVRYGSSQGVSRIDIIFGLVAGTLLAGIVWYVVNVWYYFTYDAPPEELLKKRKPAPEAKSDTKKSDPKVELGANAARTILYPRKWLFLTAPGEDPAPNKIESAETLLSSKRLEDCSDWVTARILTLVGQRGYGYEGGCKLYEAQIFAIIAMFVFLGQYLMIWPMTAPVPSFYLSITTLVILLVVVILATVVFWSAKPKPGLLKWKWGLTAGVFIFWLLVFWLYLCSSAERFPIFASVLILAISAFWTLAGVAFFVDRYRVPVFTVLLLLVTVPRLPFLHLIGSREEHYFSTVSIDRSNAEPVPTPAEILDEKLHTLGADSPLIVVTATGGGLHASAWTAAVLATLESVFADDTAGLQEEPFHKHLLLLSTVSGGSVGLSAYLHDLHDGALDQVVQPGQDQPGLEHMQLVAQCSSLEAVGWGLIFYDLPKAFIPLAPYALPPSSGDGDLDSYGTPLFKDRTWSLRKGFERNQANTYCDDLWKFDKENDASLAKPGSGPKSHLRFDLGSMFRFVLKMNRDDEQANRDAAHQLTLRSFPAANENGPPAFSMNTTSVEEGNRFLLANYNVPHYPLDANSIYPAQSFLSTFGSCGSKAPDLPLSTAAQLSATFPFVSSAARVPKSLNCHSVHFVDGGYYDNDGTASALEFLRYALASPEWLSRTVAMLERQDKATQAKTPQDEERATQHQPGQNEIQPCDSHSIPSNDQNVQLLCDELPHLNSVADKIKQQKHPLRIVWIEIRNSGDFDGGVQQTSGGNGANPTDSNLLGQLGDVPLAFWQAGHESVTARNRIALGLTEQAIPCQTQIHRIIIADSNSKKDINTDPLNWSLTPIQRNEVRTSADKVKNSSIEAKKWFYNSPEVWDRAQAANDTPCVASAQANTARPKK